MKRKVLGIVIISVLFLTAGMLYQQPGIAETGVKEIKNLGNKMCPVCGAKVKEKDNKPYEYYGKIYNVCSQKCLEEFQKNGDKYLSNVERELQGQAPVVTEVIPQEQAEVVTQAPEEAAPTEAVPTEVSPEFPPEVAPIDMPVESSESAEPHSH